MLQCYWKTSIDAQLGRKILFFFGDLVGLMDDNYRHYYF